MSKIIEQFVPYKQAEQLKELGFDEKCFGFYQNDESLAIGLEEKDMQHFTNKRALKSETYQCIAPLYSQAFDWFREKYQLFSSIKPSFCNNSSSIIFLYYYINNNEDFTCIVEYKTYQEAQLACLDKLIELVKEKK